MISDYPRLKLSEIVSRYGRAVCDDPKKCEGLLKDFCAGYRREIRALVNALESKIIDELLASSDGIPQEVLVVRLARKLEHYHGLDRELARWAVASWGIVLGRFSDDGSGERVENEQIKEQERLRIEREQEAAKSREAERTRIEQEQNRLIENAARLEEERRKLDDETRKRKKRMRLGAAVVIAAAVSIVTWYWSSSNSVKVQSVRFFAGPDGLTAQVAPTTPPRINYKDSFRSDEAPFIYYDLRLAKATKTDVALDIIWRFPDGRTVSQERSIKAGDLGTIYGRGSRTGPVNWKVGHYVVEFVWHGQTIAKAEFDVTPDRLFPPILPPISGGKFDIPDLQVNLLGGLRFYEGPSTAPPLGVRQYQNVFEGRYARWVWCEFNLKNAGDQPPRNFTVTNVIYLNGRELARWTNNFTTPVPGRDLLYSVSYGSNRMGMAQGAYLIQIFIGNQLIRTGQFSVR